MNTTGNMNLQMTNISMGYNVSQSNTSLLPSGNVHSNAPSGGSGNSFSYTEVFDLCCRSNLSFSITFLCENVFMQEAIEAEDEYFTQMGLNQTNKIILTVLYSIIMLVSLIGNSLVLLTFVLNKHMRSTTNMFIASLAASDLLLTLTAIPLDILSTLHTFWTYGSFSCKLIPLMSSFSISCSSLTLCCIAFDRFYAIVYPLKLRFFQSPAKAMVLLVTVWMISIAASFPQAISYELIPVQHRCGEEFGFLCLQPTEDTAEGEIVQVWLLFCVLFLVPLIIMGVLYGKIVHKLWLQDAIGAPTGRTDTSRLRVKQRAIKMLFVVMLIFVLCWMPLQCFIIIGRKANLESSEDIRRWRAYLQCLAISSCCYNPIVYGFMNDKFRKNFLNFLLCRKGRVFPIVSSTQSKQKVKPRFPFNKVGENISKTNGSSGQSETKTIEQPTPTRELAYM